MQESHLTKLYSSLVHTIGTSYTHVYFAWKWKLGGGGGGGGGGVQ